MLASRDRSSLDNALTIRSLHGIENQGEGRKKPDSYRCSLKRASSRPCWKQYASKIGFRMGANRRNSSPMRCSFLSLVVKKRRSTNVGIEECLAALLDGVTEDKGEMTMKLDQFFQSMKVQMEIRWTGSNKRSDEVVHGEENSTYMDRITINGWTVLPIRSSNAAT